jgi:hypothetical protein
MRICLRRREFIAALGGAGTSQRGRRSYGAFIWNFPLPHLGLRTGTQEMSRMNTKSLAPSALTVVAFIFCMVLVMRPTIVSGA